MWHSGATRCQNKSDFSSFKFITSSAFRTVHKYGHHVTMFPNSTHWTVDKYNKINSFTNTCLTFPFVFDTIKVTCRRYYTVRLFSVAKGRSQFYIALFSDGRVNTQQWPSDFEFLYVSQRNCYILNVFYFICRTVSLQLLFT